MFDSLPEKIDEIQRRIIQLEVEREAMKKEKGDEAVRALSDAVRRARSGLQDPRRPIGSFLFLGPTGVGKTEVARALAEFLFNDEGIGFAIPVDRVKRVVKDLIQYGEVRPVWTGIRTADAQEMGEKEAGVFIKRVFSSRRLLVEVSPIPTVSARETF